MFLKQTKKKQSHFRHNKNKKPGAHHFNQNFVGNDCLAIHIFRFRVRKLKIFSTF